MSTYIYTHIIVMYVSQLWIYFHFHSCCSDIDMGMSQNLVLPYDWWNNQKVPSRLRSFHHPGISGGEFPLGFFPPKPRKKHPYTPGPQKHQVLSSLPEAMQHLILPPHRRGSSPLEIMVLVVVLGLHQQIWWEFRGVLLEDDTRWGPSSLAKLV